MALFCRLTLTNPLSGASEAVSIETDDKPGGYRLMADAITRAADRWDIPANIIQQSAMFLQGGEHGAA
jgi:hypothetical protein